VAAICSDRGVNFLDAPVSRGVAGAEKGTLAIMVGGDAHVLETALPVLSVLATDIIHVGPAGSGQVAKLCNNIVAATNVVSLGEALVTGVKAGVEVSKLVEVLTLSTGGSWLLANYLPNTVFAGDRTTRFSLDLMHKDVKLFLAAAAAVDMPTPVSALVQWAYSVARSQGYGPLDYSSIVEFYGKLAELEDGDLQTGSATR
jgi:3-hydroxyisobutyrate dehydrogenase-like beta-hydroxyacid dehydrogenase